MTIFLDLHCLFVKRCFPIFINDIPCVISSQLGIYIDEPTKYSCLHSKFDRSNKKKTSQLHSKITSQPLLNGTSDDL